MSPLEITLASLLGAAMLVAAVLLLAASAMAQFSGDYSYKQHARSRKLSHRSQLSKRMGHRRASRRRPFLGER